MGPVYVEREENVNPEEKRWDQSTWVVDSPKINENQLTDPINTLRNHVFRRVEIHIGTSLTGAVQYGRV